MRHKTRRRLRAGLAGTLTAALVSIGIAALPALPAAAATIDAGTTSARLVGTTLYTGDSTNPDPGNTQANNQNGACIRYSPTVTGGGMTNWVAASSTAWTAHGRETFRGAQCPTNLDRNKQSAVGITPLNVNQVEENTLFPLAIAQHSNVTISSAGGAHLKGQLELRLSGFNNTTISFPWELWETNNDSDEYTSNNCPNGIERACDDRIRFTTTASDIELEKDGLDFRLIIEGFAEIANGQTTCPANPTNLTNNAEFWTKEYTTTQACVYGYFQQIREVEVVKQIVGDPDSTTSFTFTSDGDIPGSPWESGSATVTPTTADPDKTVFTKEIYQTDTVTITESALSAADAPFWQLTSMQCTQKDAEGNDVALSANQFSTSGSTITLTNVGEALNKNDPDITCTFTNTYQKGSLEITKTVQAPDGVNVDANTGFQVNVTCTKPGTSYSYNQNHTVKQGNLGKIAIPGLPAGAACTVTETAPSGGLPNSSYYWSGTTYSTEGGSATIPAGGTATVAITNTVSQNTGTFQVTKTVKPTTAGLEGYTGGTGRVFQVDYSCELPADTVVASGTLNVTPGTAATSPAIAAGAACTLTEQTPTTQAGDFADSSYEWDSATLTPSTFTVGTNQTATISLENTYKRTYSQLTIKKLVNPTDGVAQSATFSGTYECASGHSGSWGPIAAGGQQVISGLPVGTTCTVTETDPTTGLANASWVWNPESYSTDGGSVQIKADASAQVVVTNSASQPTGTFVVAKVVSGPDGGYTGGSSRTFPISYTCTITGGPDVTGTVNLAAGATSSAITVPQGYSCSVTETLTATDGDFADASYVWQGWDADHDSVTITKSEQSKTTVTNTFTREYGSIKLIKKVDGSGYSGTGTDFTLVYNCGAGDREVTVAEDGFVTVDNIPANTICTVSEKTPLTASLTTGYEWGTPTWDGLTAGTITVPSGQTATATVTNHTQPIYGSLTVTKKVVGGGVVSDATFPVTATCGTTSKTVNLADGASFTLNELQVGTTCTVSENTDGLGAALVDDSYAWASHTFTPSNSVTIEEKNQTVAVEVVNTTKRVYGSLVISKTVDGVTAPAGANLSFSGTWSCTYGEDERTGSWSITGSGTYTVPGLLLNSYCEVTENTPAAPSSDTSYHWAGKVVGDAVTLTATNPNPTVDITNTLGRSTGSFNVTKTVDTAAGYATDASFGFTWECTMTGWDGATGTFTLTPNTTWGGPDVEIPAGASCTVTETSTATPNTSYTWDGVTWTGGSGTQSGQGYTFTIPQPDDGENPATVAVNAENNVSKKYGSVQISKTTGEGYDGKADFTVNLACTTGTLSTVVTGGSTATVSNIPLGDTCTVTEAAPTGGLVDGSYAWDTDNITITPASFTITSSGQVVKVAIHNPTERVYGGVKVTKELIDPDGAVGVTSYSGTWSCTYGSDAPVTGTWELAAGQTSALLADNILIGSDCTATETNPGAPSVDPSYSWKDVVVTDAEVAVGTPAVVRVTNEVQRNTTAVDVTKTLVDPDGGFLGGTFQVNYECTTAGVEDVYAGSVAVEAGQTVTLFDAVPSGWDCTVTESAPSTELLNDDGSFAWGDYSVEPSSFTVGDVESVEVTNTVERVTVPVKLTKTLSDEFGVVDPAAEFSGTWECVYGSGEAAVTWDGAWSTTAGAAPITLHDAVYPGADCTVTETLTGGPSSTDPSYTWTVTGTEGTVSAAGLTLDVVNTVGREMADVTVAKQVTGAVEGYVPASEDGDFSVTLTCELPDVAPLVYNATLADGGTASFTVPQGWNCAVTEAPPGTELLRDASFAWASPEITEPQEITSDGADFTVTNPVDRVLRPLTVTKQLDDAFDVVDPERTYTGTWECVLGEETQKGTWELVAGQSAVVSEAVPVGATCTVTEDTPEVPDEDTSFYWDEVAPVETTVSDDGATATVVNTVARHTGDLEITKLVYGTSYTGGSSTPFQVNYTCTSPVDATDMITGSVNVGTSEPAVVEDLPLGWTCAVDETQPEGNIGDDRFVWDYPEILPAQVDIVEGTADVTVANFIVCELAFNPLAAPDTEVVVEVADAATPRLMSLSAQPAESTMPNTGPRALAFSAEHHLELCDLSYSLDKTADPISGSTVDPGDTIEYTVTVTNTGTLPYTDAVISDDFTGWDDHAQLVGGSMHTSQGEILYTARGLNWTVGELEVGASATLSYSVLVNSDAWDVTLVNTVTGTGDVPPVTTTHVTPPEPADPIQIPDTGGTQMPVTGIGQDTAFALQGALALIVAGLVLVWFTPRRKKR